VKTSGNQNVLGSSIPGLRLIGQVSSRWRSRGGRKTLQPPNGQPSNGSATNAGSPIQTNSRVIAGLEPAADGKSLECKVSSVAANTRAEPPPINGLALTPLGHQRATAIAGAPAADNSALAPTILTFGQSVALHSTTSTAVSSILVLILVGVIDCVSGPRLSFGAFYLVPVSFAAWFAGKRTGVIMGILASVVWLIADAAASPAQFHLGSALWNLSSRGGVFLFVVLMLVHIRALHLGLEATVAKRTRQLKAETGRRLEMEREIAAVSHREQQRIAHELHDGLGQELGAMAFQAKFLVSQLDQARDPLATEARNLVQCLNEATGRTRSLSHLLDPLGERAGSLRHALGLLADQSGRAFGIACTFDAPDELPALSGDRELNLYRITQEALHNSVQHGSASEVFIGATLAEKTLRIIVADNGLGFVPGGTSRGYRGMGLRIMKYRADAINGSLEVRSAPGQGCTVSCSVSLPECTAS
jgi:signal transduction histidine kinase